MKLKLLSNAVVAALALPERLFAPRAEGGDFERWPGVNAGADLSGAQFAVVKLSGADTVALSTAVAIGDRDILGILQNKPSSGQAAYVAREGYTKAVAGAAITVNKLLTHNSSGRVITVNSGDSKWIIGRALEAASNDGDVISIEVHRPVWNAGLAL